MDPTYTVKEVARICQVHPETVRRWIRAKWLKAVRVGSSGPGGKYRVTRRELERVMHVGGPRG